MELFNTAQKITQPDGQIINCFSGSDEHFKFLHDENGKVIIKNHETNFYTYAQYKNGSILPSQNIITQQLLNDSNVNIVENSVKGNDIKTYINNFFSKSFSFNLISTPNVSVVTGLIIFLRFSDDAEFRPKLDLYVDLFNSQNPKVISMYNHFKENSGNKIFLTHEFYPQSISPTITSYQDYHPRGYFMPYDESSNIIGYKNDIEKEDRKNELLRNVINGISTQVNPSINLDIDNDGNIDNVILVIKGDTSLSSELFCPQPVVYPHNDIFINNKKLFNYSFQLESVINSILNIVATKIDNIEINNQSTSNENMEISNQYPSKEEILKEEIVVSQPLKSETKLNTSNTFVSTNPEYSCAYMKYRYEKVIKHIPSITTSGTYSLNPLTSNLNNAFRINTSLSSTEYFIVEYRKNLPLFEDGFPGTGLVVYRINTSRDGTGNGNPNNISANSIDEVFCFTPRDSQGDSSLAFLSKESGNTSIGGPDNPLFLSNGTPTEIVISNVGVAKETISFDVTVHPSLYLTIINSEPFSPVELNDIFDYHLEVTNYSGIVANNVIVTHDLPSNLEIISVTSSSGISTNTGNKANFNIPYLYPGQKVTITITVKAIEVGSFSNTSSLSASNYALSFSNTVTTTIEDNSTPVITISESVSESSIYVGDILDYEILVSNNSNVEATDVVVEDTLPIDSLFISASTSCGSCSRVEDKLICTIGSLNPNESITISIKIKSLKVGTLSNSSTVCANEIVAIESNTVLTTVASFPLILTKFSSGTDFYVDDIFDYTITLTNNSMEQFNNVVVNDSLPLHLEVISATSTKGSCSIETEQYSHNKVICAIDEINPNDTINITITAKAVKTGLFVNGANVIAYGLPEITCKPITVNIKEKPIPVLSINTISSMDKIYVGESFKYDVIVSNISTTPATNVIISDYLPSELEFISAVSTKNYCSSILNKVSCSVGTLSPDETVTITIQVKGLNTGTISNLAHVAGENFTPIDSNEVRTTVSNIPLPDLSITNNVSSDEAYVNNKLVYELVIENNSNVKATNVVVEDYLPNNIELISSQSTKGTCSNFKNKIRCNIGDINPSESVIMTIVINTLEPGTISNNALLRADLIPDMESNHVNTEVIKQKNSKTNHSSKRKYYGSTNYNYHKPQQNSDRKSYNHQVKVNFRNNQDN